MKSLRTSVAVLFVLAALVPVLLAVIVWTAAARTDDPEASRLVALATNAIEQHSHQGLEAVNALCRDDLALDRLMEVQAAEEPLDLDYDRLFDGKRRAAGLQSLWLLDARSGQALVSVGDTPPAPPAIDLLPKERSSGPFMLPLGPGEPRFVAYSCRIERGGIALVVVGAHTVSELRSLDPDRFAIRTEARKGEVTLLEIPGPPGTSWFVVFRADSSSAPPLLIWLLVVGVVALGLALFSGSYLSRWLEAEVDELTVAATRIGAGDLATTLREGDRGPFRATATAFNQMTRDLRTAQQRLRQTERIAAWQDIAKRLAHELKNPLSPIRLSIETLRKAHERSHDDFDALFDETTATILQEVERLRHIVDEFSRFARLPPPVLQATDLAEIVRQVASLYAEGPVRVESLVPDTPVVVTVDSEQMTQVLHNLVQNACDAARHPHGETEGLVRLHLERAPREVQISVEDNGPGIPPELQSAVFEPYQTDKEEGSGLGLAISSRIVTEHGGRIDLSSTPGRTVFTVTLPTDRA